MGCRVPLGAGRPLTLRLRILAAAVGIVAVSLLLSGALTWVLVRNLEVSTAQGQLDLAVQVDRVLVRHQECLVRPALVSNEGATNCKLDNAVDYQDRLVNLAVSLSTDRLLLLDRQRTVVFDSVSPATTGQVISFQPAKRVANVEEAGPTLGGQSYLAAAVALTPARDPLGAAFVVVARPRASIVAAAAGELAPLLLEAGGAALLVAMLLVLLVSRSLTRPLAQLAGAAEDIAAGNYSRRVGIRGHDEIGTLGKAFDRMAEAVERARMVQREFLANVSHELKTPLTSLIGFSQALVDGSLRSDVERTRAANIVHEESERVLRMAQELLDLARVEAGSISLHITAVDLGAQLEQELEIVRPRAGARRLGLTLAVPVGVRPVAADPERLHQILDNLLDNAIKYAPDGTAIRISAKSNISGVETIVSNPAGLHPPDPERMFERFYRADPSRSSAAGGVGLGLAISRELAAAMKGRLWADFDDAGELRVHLLLPASREPETREGPAPDSIPFPAA
ncbi:MAG TPA: HAMP domain-containing sensor histidine kinase [Candidatus Dormibacteraeota bacterium]|nr:HAMP domain-containing sensor histidine kinase [Candidatus Dormibacteraeota bacterium]